MKTPEITIERKMLWPVKVHSVSYQDEGKPKPQFEGELHAVLVRFDASIPSLHIWNGTGAKFFVAKDDEWGETEL